MSQGEDEEIVEIEYVREDDSDIARTQRQQAERRAVSADRATTSPQTSQTRSPSVPREMYAPARRTDLSPRRASKQVRSSLLSDNLLYDLIVPPPSSSYTMLMMLIK